MTSLLLTVIVACDTTTNWSVVLDPCIDLLEQPLSNDEGGRLNAIDGAGPDCAVCLRSAVCCCGFFCAEPNHLTLLSRNNKADPERHMHFFLRSHNVFATGAKDSNGSTTSSGTEH